MADLTVKLGNLTLPNPVMTASGCCGFGLELVPYLDLDKLGGMMLKGTTLANKPGNPTPRIVETPSGLINSIGLQNKGVQDFINDKLPKLEKYKVPIFVNASATSVGDYEQLIELLEPCDRVTGYELNISCPNVKEGGISFGKDPRMAAEITTAVKKKTGKHVMVKLSPNVTSVSEIAKAVEGAGADSVSLVNTFVAMSIDIETRKPGVAMGTGGLSGPAIKPIAVAMVHEVHKAVKIPVVGMGGISNAADAIEFMLAGASAVQVGTALFWNPRVLLEIIDGISEYLDRHSLKSVSEIVGAVQL